MTEDTLVSKHEHKLYKNHGKAVGWWSISIKVEDALVGTGKTSLCIRFAKTLDGMVVEKLSVVKGKNIGKANETSAIEQARSELQSRIDKQLRLGYVRTIEEAAAPKTNGLGKKLPMLAEPLKKVDIDEIDWDNAFVQRKFDGHRCLSDDFIYSRGGVAHNVPHIQEIIKASPSLDALHLDGELYIHGMTLQAIGSLITKPREESTALTYVVYDCVSDQPFEDRYARVADAFAAEWLTGLDVRLQLVETHKVRNLAEAMVWHRKWVKEGYEGSILRWGRDGYEDGKRTKKLVKLKDFSDFEVKVVGWELAKQAIVKGTTYQIPKFIYEVDTPAGIKTAKVLAHGSVPEKHAEWEALVRGENIPRILTIAHFGFTPDGIPNIATAKCWYNPL